MAALRGLLCMLVIALTVGTRSASSQEAALPARPPLGTNLARIDEGSTEYAFVDAFKSSRPWISGSATVWNDGRALDLDADGWVRSLQPDQVARTVMFGAAGMNYPVGTYEVLFDGEGTIGYCGGVTSVERTPGRHLLQVDSARGGIFLCITRTDPANPVRNLRVRMPGDFAADEIFHPTFLDRIRSYGAIRFMDWMAINGLGYPAAGNPQARWEDRSRTTEARWSGTRGVPVEIMIALANRVGIDPWFCIPHLADDDYVRRFAEQVRDTLDPGLRVHVEYSNEVWNPAYAQARHARTEGLALGLSADPFQAQMRFHARRSREVFAIWEEVLPADRLVRVLASPAADPALSETLLSFEDTAAHVDALTIAPFFGIAVGDQERIRLLDAAALLADLETRVLPGVMDLARGHAAVAAAYGKGLLAYAGGQNLVAQGTLATDATLNALYDAANRDPGMGTLYSNWLAQWHELSQGGLLAHDTHCGRFTRFSRRGSLETFDQPREQAPKYDALQRFLENHSAAEVRRLPVLMVIANRDFYYREYADPREVLEAAGFDVQVAAATLAPCVPHTNSGEQGRADGGIVQPDLTLLDVDATNFQTVVFVGGWGSSMYQYAFPGRYTNAAYDAGAETREAVNRLIQDLVAQDKYVTALCHGVTVLAWARVDGVSPISGRSVAGYALGSPASVIDGVSYAANQLPSRWHNETNGAFMFASRSLGDPRIADDDVWVDGKIITGENYDSARRFGEVLVEELNR